MKPQRIERTLRRTAIHVIVWASLLIAAYFTWRHYRPDRRLDDPIIEHSEIIE